MIFRALRHRNYRLFFIGQGISITGTWMQEVAVYWLLYRLTNSVLVLGLVSFADQMPAFFITPLAGVLADRWNRHRILIVTQTLAMIQAFILAALTLSGRITVWQVVVLSVLLGIVDAFEVPTRQSFVPEMVEGREDLPNAIALNSFMVNSGRLLGPALAGFWIALAGEGICFLANGVSFCAVVVALLAMRVKPHRPSVQRRRVLKELKEGFSSVFGFPPVRAILGLVALASVMGRPYMVLAPVFVREILHGGPKTLGFLMGSAGAGALMGAVFLASRRSVRGLGRVIAAASALFGVGLMAVSFSRVLWLAMVFMLLIGCGMMVQLVASNTFLQTIAEDDKRGRMMSFYTMAFMGMLPFGSLWAGWMGHWIGVAGTLLIGGVVCLAGALLFARQLPHFRTHVRPLYIRMGIISEAR